MLKILIIKTSSLGDVIHTLPALEEASEHIPNISFDWVIEESFSEIPKWHHSVDKVIPFALRRFRKHPIEAIKSGEAVVFLSSLREREYDYIIDAQGLLFKSALVSLIAKGTRCGFDFSSAREGFASLCYERKFDVDRNQHAILRTKELFAKVLDYKPSVSHIQCGISFVPECSEQSKNLIFIHGTSREDKCWPEESWRKLAVIATSAGFVVQLPWGSEHERERALRIACNISNVHVLPKCKLNDLAAIFVKAMAVVAVDTGLGHMAAAFGLPVVSLYGDTDPALIGTCGQNQVHLKAVPNASKTLPCSSIDVDTVWNALQPLLSHV